MRTIKIDFTLIGLFRFKSFNELLKPLVLPSDLVCERDTKHYQYT